MTKSEPCSSVSAARDVPLRMFALYRWVENKVSLGTKPPAVESTSVTRGFFLNSRLRCLSPAWSK